MRTLPFALLLSLCLPCKAYAQTRLVRIESKVLGEQRVLHISLPTHYALARQRYPVTYLLDGQARPFFDLTVAAASYDLAGADSYAMPAQIVVGVEQIDRRKDLATNDSAFRRFLTEEVVPYVEREYRTLPYRTLIGHSLAGQFALGTFCDATTTFAAVVAISPGIADSATFDRITGCARTSWDAGKPRVPARVRTVVLSAGSAETRTLAATYRLAAFLVDSAPQAWRTVHLADAGVSHTDAPLRSIPGALQFVFHASQWELPPALADSVSRALGDADALLARGMRDVSSRFGFDVPLSFRWLSARSSQLLASGTVEQADEAARQLVAEYPEQLQGYTNLADARVRARDYSAARSALSDGLALLRKRADFDETQRAGVERVLREALAALPR